MSNTSAPMDRREDLRRRAWELNVQGWKQCHIAAAVAVPPRSVSQWLKRGHGERVEELRRHPAPGPTPKLTAEQLAQILALLERGAEAYGFRGERWTCTRVAAVIRCMFGDAYRTAHISRLLHALRQSVQRPIARANQRNEQAIQAWRQERWPALEKSPQGGARRRLGRSVRVLPLTAGGPYVGATTPDAGFYASRSPVTIWQPSAASPRMRDSSSKRRTMLAIAHMLSVSFASCCLRSAARYSSSGMAAHPSRPARQGLSDCRLPTDTINEREAKPSALGIALYARVSSADQQADMTRQLQRLRECAAARGYQVVAEVTEIAFGSPLV